MTALSIHHHESGPSPELRVSQQDLTFFSTGVASAILAGLHCWWIGAIIWFVFGVHLLFSHVFRVSIPMQAGWGMVFALASALTIVKGQPGWAATFGFSFALAMALIILEMKPAEGSWLRRGFSSGSKGSSTVVMSGSDALVPDRAIAVPPTVAGRHPFVDALRGYAILAVIMVHSTLLVRPENKHLAQIMLFGVRGVELFFVASAFTLCLSWQQRAASERSPLRNFFVRRFFRIAPMFYVAIVLYCSLYGFAPRMMGMNSVQWWHLPVTTCFLHGFSPETVNSVVPGGWSVAVEAAFYVMLPSLLLRLRSVKSIIAFFVASIMVSLMSKPLLQELLTMMYSGDRADLVSGFAGKNILVRLPVFAAGMVAWCAFRDRERLHQWGLIAMLLTAPLIFLECSFTGSSPREVLLGPVHAGILFALAALVIAAFPLRLLVNRWICELGKISYSVYLLHFIVLDLVSRLVIFHEGNLSSVIHFMVVTLTSVAFASLARRFVELPGIEMGRRLIARWERESTK